MDKIRALIEKLNGATPKVQEEELLKIIKKHEARLVDYNIEQMMEGKNSDGSVIEPAYTERTVEIKKHKGQRSDVVTLRDEGVFQQKMEADTRAFPVDISSADFKTPKLVDKYGEKIFNLNNENTEKFVREDIAEDIKQYYKDLFSV